MIVTERDKVRDEVSALVERFGRSRSSLIPILQEIQKSHYEISEFVMQVVADELGIHPVEVYSVVSFYSFLGGEAKGKFVIRLCRTISCMLEGTDRVARQFETDLGIKFGETTKCGRFTLEWANCLGMCDQGPAVLVNDRVFTQVTPEKVHDILEECRRALSVYATERKEAHLV